MNMDVQLERTSSLDELLTLRETIKDQFGAEAGAADAMVWSWCRKELAHWQARRLDYASALREMRRRSDNHAMEFLFSIRDGRASIAPKKPETPDRVPIWRPPFYLNFLNEVVNRFCPDLEIDLLINVNDGNINREPIPIFSFQKPAGSNSILLPDVDFIEHGFYYPNPGFADPNRYDEKTCSAVFVGSTTGGIVTNEAMVNRTHPRIRSAIFFKDNPTVDFRLPVLTPMAEDVKRKLLEAGFGKGDKLSFQQQFKHKFVISMDGWGATCSRLPVTLRSNSVLLKYTSPHQLYYFSGMIPWFHFIPIAADEEVNDVIRIEQQEPGSFAMIAQNGKDFADNYLTRMQCMKYTAWLIRAYADSFASPSSVYSFRAKLRPYPAFEPPVVTADEEYLANRSPSMDVVVHISDRGDLLYRMTEWTRSERNDAWVEGFTLEPAFGIRPSDLEYRGVNKDGVLSEPRTGGMFVGTKGKRQPLYGLAIRTTGPIAHLWGCEYTARFGDGSEVGPVRQGVPCRAASGAPLTSFQLKVVQPQ
jgi:hypothetical protein